MLNLQDIEFFFGGMFFAMLGCCGCVFCSATRAQLWNSNDECILQALSLLSRHYLSKDSN